MQPVIASPPETTRQLDAEESARVVATAIRERIVAKLQVRGGTVAYEACGALIGEDGAHLLFRCESQWRAPDGETVPCPLSDSRSTRGVHVVMEVGGARYVFDALCVEETSAGDSRVVRVLKPVALSAADRRRSPRRRLRKATAVALHASGARGRTFCNAVMLNLSADGIACRIPRRDAEPFVPGQAVWVVFRLHGDAPAFNLQARIANMTEGGTADQMVVGLEFIADTDPAGDRSRLREALKVQR